MQKLKSKRKRSRAESTAVSKFISVQIFSLISYAVIFPVFSIVALTADLPMKYDYYFAIATFIICSFFTGYFTGKKVRANGLLVGVLYSLPINIIILLISLILVDFKADISLLISALLLILSAAAGGVLSVNKRRSK